MSKPLTDAEIAEVGDWLAVNLAVPVSIAARLLDHVTRSRALLKRIEPKGRTCPECDAVEDAEEHIAHKPDCELAALLGW